MNSNKSALLLPKLKEPYLQKYDHPSTMKLDYRDELKNLYGSKINRYQRMLKAITDTNQGSSMEYKAPEVSKLRSYEQNLSQGNELSQNDSTELNQRSSLKGVDQHKTHNQTQIPVINRQQILSKVNSEPKPDVKNDRINSSFGNENHNSPLHKKNGEAFGFIKGEINRFENMGRNRGLKKDPYARYSTNSTPIKLKPIINDTLSQAHKDISIAEVNEREDRTRKENISGEKNNTSAFLSTKYPKIIVHPQNEIVAAVETMQNKNSPQSFELGAKRLQKPYSPFFDKNKSDAYNKLFPKQNLPKRNLLEIDLTQKAAPNDPETISKINLEKIYELQKNLLDLAECANDTKQAQDLAIKFIEMADQIDYFDIENPLLDPEEKIRVKNYLFAERVSLWCIILVIKSDSRGLTMFDLLQNMTSMLYLNFISFVDFLLARFVSSYKQHKWHSKFRALREKRGEKNEAFGSHSEKLLRACRMATMQLSKVELSKQVDLLFEKLKQSSFDKLKQSSFENIYLSFKKLLAKEIKAWKINVSLAEESEIQHQKIKERPPTQNSVENLKTSFHLPPLRADENNQTYSLVLDLDETLIHFEQSNGKQKFFVRPYAEIFLKEMSPYYELIVFTAAVKDYADTIINIIDKHHYVKHRLYRNHTDFSTETNTIVKDLTKLGRDLNHTIIIDNSPDNFRLQQDNGIEIKSWYSDPYDCELLELVPFLKDIVHNKVQDVRVPIRKLKEYKQKHKNMLGLTLFKP